MTFHLLQSNFQHIVLFFLLFTSYFSLINSVPIQPTTTSTRDTNKNHLILSSLLTKLSFPSSRHKCIGGNALFNHSFKPNHVIICHLRNISNQPSPISLSSARWNCKASEAGLVYKSFFRIDHARVLCSDTGIDLNTCRLHYHLDFTTFAIFLLGFLSTILAGFMIALIMYVTLIKLANLYQTKQPASTPLCQHLENDHYTYGSFGRFVRLPQGVTLSFSSLAELECNHDKTRLHWINHLPSPLESPPSRSITDSDSEDDIQIDEMLSTQEQNTKVNRRREQMEWLQSQIYLG